MKKYRMHIMVVAILAIAITVSYRYLVKAHKAALKNDGTVYTVKINTTVSFPQ